MAVNLRKKTITWATLLIRKVTFWKPNNRCIAIRLKELEARDTATLEEANGPGMSTLIKMAKETEHGELENKNDKELSDDEERAFQHISPNFLTAEEWQDDMVNNAVENII